MSDGGDCGSGTDSFDTSSTDTIESDELLSDDGSDESIDDTEVEDTSDETLDEDPPDDESECPNDEGDEVESLPEADTEIEEEGGVEQEEDTDTEIEDEGGAEQEEDTDTEIEDEGDAEQEEEANTEIEDEGDIEQEKEAETEIEEEGDIEQEEEAETEIEADTQTDNTTESLEYEKDSFFFHRKDATIKQDDLKYQTTPCRDMIDTDEYRQYSRIYDKLDTMDISQDYKDVLINRISNMDTELKGEYNKYADKLKCNDTAYYELDENGVPQDAAYFSPIEGGFKINQHEDLHNPLGAGNTFFHESGHMIDWLKGQESDTGNASYETYMTEAVHEDYFNALQNIMNDNDNPCDRERAQEILSRKLMKEPNASNCVSDVFGGVSFNKVFGVWGHSDEYWRNNSRDIVGKEAFAEITADRACNNERNLDFTRRYMPKTMKAYENALKYGGKR